jgi:hypothetical protein
VGVLEGVGLGVVLGVLVGVVLGVGSILLILSETCIILILCFMILRTMIVFLNFGC